MATFQLEPIEAVFHKVILDLNLTTHSIDSQAFMDWAMEAIDHIGGLSRIPANKVVSGRVDSSPQSFDVDLVPIVDFKAMFPKAVIKVDEVRYFGSSPKDEDDYVIATPTPNKKLDASEKDVHFEYIHLVDGGELLFGLIFNRQTGYMMSLGQKYPMMYDKSGDELGVFIPSLASYKDAIYWYITMKLLWRDVYRGRNKQQQLSYAAGMFNNMKNLAYGELMMPDKWELEQLAAELSLGVSYTGLNKRLANLATPDGLELFIAGKKRTYDPLPHPWIPTPPAP